MKLGWFVGREQWGMIFLITLISALTYLPLIDWIGYINDDWYLMYSARAYGPGVFVNIFSVDRPGRALVMIPAYMLFGENPLYYNLSAYVFRLLSAFALFGLLKILWPRQTALVFGASLLYLIYPGFLSQINGIDYQSQMVSLAAALFSLTLSVKAAFMERGWQKFTLFALSTLLGWLYLGLVEYFIGFELFRWGCVFLLSSRRGGALIQKAWCTIRLAYPSILVPSLFLIWRLFFFQSERGATNVNAQFEQVRLYPIQTLYHWVVQVIQDLFDVMISAWVIPLSQLTRYVQVWGLVLAVILAGLSIYFLSPMRDGNDQERSSQKNTGESLLLGFFMIVAGLIPIVMVNREVSFPFFSRYSLVSSAGVAIFVSVLLLRVKWRILQNGLIAILVFVSILTHHANAVKAAQQTAFTNEFWWQVSWRVPQLAKNTTLIANYPGVPLEEDYFVWGPANLIYYPEKQNEKNIQPGVFAVLLKPDTVEKVLARERQVYDKRKNIITYPNYRNILVMIQPSLNSCVHILDGMKPEYSVGEWNFVEKVGPFSEIEHVLTDEASHTPPTVVFGAEPDRGWCYYYQKADLARQRGEWEKVLEIGEQAFGQGLEPQDLVEWMPFLQAFAITGDVNRLSELAPLIGLQPFITEQACQILVSTQGLSESVTEAVKALYCSG